MNARLAFQIFSMEIRRALAYRTDFWISFFAGTAAQFAVAWYLWKSVFDYKGIDSIGGFSFGSLMIYYLLAPIVGRTVFGGNLGDIASEIYQGSLTRYLIYPVSFIYYKLIVHLANTFILLLQLILVIGATSFLVPSFTYSIGWSHILQGTITIAAAATLYFILSGSIQLIAFWADQIWSLSAILRFITGLLGGSLIPLSLFPDGLQPLLRLLPFSCFVHLPLQCFLGNVSLKEWCEGLAVMAVWGIVCGAVYAVLWRRGMLRYSGVGI